MSESKHTFDISLSYAAVPLRHKWDTKRKNARGAEGVRCETSRGGRAIRHPIEGLTLSAPIEVGLATFVPLEESQFTRYLPAGAPGEEVFRSYVTDRHVGAVADIDADSLDQAVACVTSLVAVLRVFIKCAYPMAETTMFGVGGDLPSSLMGWYQRGTRDGIGFSRRGHFLGFEFGPDAMEKWNAASGFRFAASAVGQPGVDEGGRRAELGVELLSQDCRTAAGIEGPAGRDWRSKRLCLNGVRRPSATGSRDESHTSVARGLSRACAGATGRFVSNSDLIRVPTRRVVALASLSAKWLTATHRLCRCVRSGGRCTRGTKHGRRWPTAKPPTSATISRSVRSGGQQPGSSRRSWTGCGSIPPTPLAPWTQRSLP